MDLVRHLRCFVAVAEELHFGRAAERLHISQPPLSQRIRALERRVGGELFARTSRRVTLTPLGRRLLPDARALVERADALERTLDHLAAADVRHVRVGLPRDLPAELVAALLRAGREVATDLELEVHHGAPADLERAATDGTARVAVLHHPIPVGVHVGCTFERRAGLLVGAGTALAAADEIDVVGLDGVELVMAPWSAGPAQHDRVLGELAALGFAPTAVRVADGPEAAAGIVLAGGAVALTDRPGPPTDGVVWRPLVGSTAIVRVAVARRLDAAPVELVLVRIVEQLLVDLDGWEPITPPAAGPPRPRPASGLAW